MCALKLIASETLGYSPKYQPGRASGGELGSIITASQRSEDLPAALDGPTTALDGPTKAPALDTVDRRRVKLCLRDEASSTQLSFYGTVPLLYASTNNPGANLVTLELVDSFRASERPATTSVQPRALRRRTGEQLDTALIFLLYLDSETWIGDAGVLLADEVRAARTGGMRIVMLHEMDIERGGCEFARFFETTPKDLINDGLYDALALALHADEYRSVSLLLAAQALGASDSVHMTAGSWRARLGNCLIVRKHTRASSYGPHSSRNSAGEASASIGVKVYPTAAQPSNQAARQPATGARGRSLFRSVVFGSAVLHTSALWVWPSSTVPAEPPWSKPPLLLGRPPAAAALHERVLFPRPRRNLEYLTVVLPNTYHRDDPIEFVNLDPVRESTVSCECLKRVKVALYKTEQGVLTRTLDLVVAEDPSGPVFSNWTIVSLNHSVPRPVQFLSFESLSGAVSDPGVQMHMAAHALAEAGFEAGYEATMVINISRGDGAADADVPVEVDVEVLARAVPGQTVWGNVPPAHWCNETNGTEAAAVAQQRLGGGLMTLVYGSTMNLSFTACDVEGLPLWHSVPTERDGLPDPRQFTAELRNDTTGDVLAMPVDSPASGRYVAAVTPDRLGAYALHLHLGTSDLDRQRATPSLGELLVEVVCPFGLVPDPATLTCTCDRGYQPRSPIGGGLPGVLANGCESCRPGLFKPQLGEASCQPCAAGNVQPAAASALCDACIPGTSQSERGRVACNLCPARTNSTAPYTACAICQAGLYRTSVEVLANSESCQPCPVGTECPYGSTILPALLLQPGTWRISGGARHVELCQAGEGNTSACQGGYVTGTDGAGYCEPGHSGPVCEVCVDEGHYFDWRTASCTECPPAATYALVYSLLVGLPALLVCLLLLAYRRSPRMQAAYRKAKAGFVGQKIDAKIKLIVGFLQVVTVVGHVYSISLPNLYRRVLQALEMIYIDIFGDIIIPSSCMGGFASVLLLKGCLPLALLAVAAVARAGWWLHHQPGRLSVDRADRLAPALWPRLAHTLRQCAKTTGMAMLPPTLWMATLFCVSVSASVFSTFHCRRFIEDSDTKVIQIIPCMYVNTPTRRHLLILGVGMVSATWPDPDRNLCPTPTV